MVFLAGSGDGLNFRSAVVRGFEYSYRGELHKSIAGPGVSFLRPTSPALISFVSFLTTETSLLPSRVPWVKEDTPRTIQTLSGVCRNCRNELGGDDAHGLAVG